MDWKHALIELFFVGVGVFAIWSIYDTLRRHWHQIVEIIKDEW